MHAPPGSGIALESVAYLYLVGKNGFSPESYEPPLSIQKSHSKLRDASAHGDTVSLTGQPLSAWYIRFVTEVSGQLPKLAIPGTRNIYLLGSAGSRSERALARATESLGNSYHFESELCTNEHAAFKHAKRVKVEWHRFCPSIDLSFTLYCQDPWDSRTGKATPVIDAVPLL